MQLPLLNSSCTTENRRAIDGLVIAHEPRRGGGIGRDGTTPLAPSCSTVCERLSPQGLCSVSPVVLRVYPYHLYAPRPDARPRTPSQVPARLPRWAGLVALRRHQR